MEALSGLVAIALVIAVGFGILRSQRTLALGRARVAAEFRTFASDLARRHARARTWVAGSADAAAEQALRAASSALRVAEADPVDPEALAELAAAENALTRALRALPLGGDGEVEAAARELVAVERRLEPSAHVLRQACAAHGRALRGFPGVVVGRLFGYHAPALPEIEWALRRGGPGLP